jgi:hypothetical protein
MKTIWKFPLPIEDSIKIKMPPFAQILSVGYQQESPRNIMLWALVDDGYKDSFVTRKFQIRGTGHPCDGIDLKDPSIHFIGTVIIAEGRLVFHIFECEIPLTVTN